jgi:hypothetical protein
VKQQLPQQPQQQRQQAAPPASSTWQPPLRPRSLAGLPSISLWQLGGPLAWAYMLGYLAVMLVLPITALLAKASLVPLADFLSRATEPVALSAYFVSFSMALLAGAVNAVFGFLLAWVLVKYDFPGAFTRLCGCMAGSADAAHPCRRQHTRARGRNARLSPGP